MNEGARLTSIVAAIQARLDAVAACASSEAPPDRAWETDPRFVHLATCFGLDIFEVDVLAFALAATIDVGVVLAAERLGGRGGRGAIDPVVVVPLLGGAWSAFTPNARLRAHCLLEPDKTRGLALAEPVLTWLLGSAALDATVAVVVNPVEETGTLAESQLRRAAEIAGQRDAAAIGVYGADPLTRQAVVVAAAKILGLRPYRIRASLLPRGAALDAWVRAWERDAMLLGLGLLIEAEESNGLPEFLDRRVARGGVWISADRAFSALSLPAVPIARPDTAERLARWTAALDTELPQVTALAAQFKVGFDTIAQAASTATVETPERRVEMAWGQCRVLTRGRMEDLAWRIDARARWEDLVVPVRSRQILRDLITQVRGRFTVDVAWGFGTRSSKGHGIATLFYGPSGTGKTMAAEVVANELGLDLYQIDLSSVVSKYIGETEKHLNRVFDAAEAGGAILLFDEADALFGKRSEVHDARDRYANIEVSYLLQRIEAYGGLAILTSNMKDNLDLAFQRRLRFAVGFTWPDATQRLEMWQRVFPPEAPVEDVDYARLAMLDVSGANIRNIAVHAAYFAVSTQEPIGMRHLVRAARDELGRMGRPVPELLFGGRS